MDKRRDPFDDPFFKQNGFNLPSKKKVVGLGCGACLLNALLYVAIVAAIVAVVVFVAITVARAALG